MRKINWRDLVIKPHNIVVACTSDYGYDAHREILLELDSGYYVVLDGWHCSCYDFDETEWEAIEYTEEELKKLAYADYNKDSFFWNMVRKQLFGFGGIWEVE